MKGKQRNRETKKLNVEDERYIYTVLCILVHNRHDFVSYARSQLLAQLHGDRQFGITLSIAI